MEHSNETFAQGDKCLLFLNLPIDSSLFSRYPISKLPIELASGIYLARTPQHALACAAGTSESKERNIGLAAWVYPGYGLGMGICNACIKVDATVPAALRERYLWFMVEALYLAKPLYIHMAGSFTYGNEEEGFLGRMPSRIDHRSNISLNPFFSHANGESLLKYNEDDLKHASIYFSRIVRIFEMKQTAPRPYFNLKAFFEATLWERSIYASTSFSKLFPLMDSFAGNPTHDHDKKTSKRLSLFLKEITGPLLAKSLSEEEIRLRLLSIWHLHRAPDLHGYLKEPDLPVADVAKQDPIDRPELKDLFDLMEFARLCLIKMLLLDEAAFQEYCQIPIPRQKYKNKDAKVNAERAREAASKAFFEEKSYPTRRSLAAYTDFAGEPVIEAPEEEAAMAVITS